MNMNKLSVKTVKGVEIVNLAGGLKQLVEKEVTVVSFGPIHEEVLETMSADRAVKAAEAVRDHIAALERVNAGIGYEATKEAIRGLKADLADWVRITEHLAAKVVANTFLGTGEELPF